MPSLLFFTCRWPRAFTALSSARLSLKIKAFLLQRSEGFSKHEWRTLTQIAVRYAACALWTRVKKDLGLVLQAEKHPWHHTTYALAANPETTIREVNANYLTVDNDLLLIRLTPIFEHISQFHSTQDTKKFISVYYMQPTAWAAIHEIVLFERTSSPALLYSFA